jgi:hypothetical protein
LTAPDVPSLDFLLFTVDLEMAQAARAAGIDGLVVDWEWRGKLERQNGADTEINRDTPEQLGRLSTLESMRRCCRVNAFGEWTRDEVEAAIENGATDLLLPMVRAPDPVERFLRHIDGRARAGILVETVEACERAEDLARLPLDLVYLGLNDLAIQRGHPCIFLPLVDGTAERLRDVFGGVPLGFAGLTVVDGGRPVPCQYLLQEMARLECDFAFMRRSFRRDIVGRDMPGEIARLRAAWREVRQRDRATVESDHRKLERTLRELFPAPDRSARA